MNLIEIIWNDENVSFINKRNNEEINVELIKRKSFTSHNLSEKIIRKKAPKNAEAYSKGEIYQEKTKKYLIQYYQCIQQQLKT